MVMTITQEMKDRITELIRDRLTPKRFKHSLNVARRAAELAERYGENRGRAEYAGLAHDICKNMSHEEQLALIRSSGVEPDPVTLRMPQLYHAIAGYCYLRRTLGVDDGEILDAVRYHTTGRAGMSRLEKIVYLADLTSDDRDYPDVGKARAAADKSLEDGMVYALRYIIGEMTGSGKLLCPDSVDAYNDAILQRDAARGGHGA